jgi:ubiquitin-like protein Pup
MATQERAQKRGPQPESEAGTAAASPALAERGARIKKSIDAVVDEIDDVLEENAEEFVKGYVQRGGE